MAACRDHGARGGHSLGDLWVPQPGQDGRIDLETLEDLGLAGFHCSILHTNRTAVSLF